MKLNPLVYENGGPEDDDARARL